MIYEFLGNFPDQIKHAYQLETPRITSFFTKVRIIGMGGSYIAGLAFKSMFEKYLGIPIDVSHGFNLIPEERALYVLISYSGNTKEVVRSFRSLRKNNVLVISSGGELIKMATKEKKKMIKIPHSLHQRFTIGYCLFPLIRCFVDSGYIKNIDKILDIDRLVKMMKSEEKRIEIEAVELAVRLKEKHPLFYASDYFYPAAYRLQTSIEEDAKMICHSNTIPELFHNELEALPDDNFFPILIIDKQDAENFEGQIKYFKNHIKDYHELKFERYGREERMMMLFHFTNYLGYHLSKIKQTDMGETPLSDEIKRR